MEDYLKTAVLNPSTYFFGLATCGGSFGVSLYHLREILKVRNCKLSYGRVCYMIANSTATWKKEVAYDYRKLDGETKVVKETVQAVTDRKVDTSLMKPSLVGKIMASDFIKKLGMKRFAVSVDPAHCVGCGICTRICPAHNITLQNQKAVTGSRCAYCMACVHACPHGGMQVNGHKIKKENQPASGSGNERPVSKIKRCFTLRKEFWTEKFLFYPTVVEYLRLIFLQKNKFQLVI